MASDLEEIRATSIPDEVLYEHLRFDPEYATSGDKTAAKLMYSAAVSYIQEYCAVDEAYMDSHPDMTIAVLAVTRDLFDNRSATAEKSVAMNPTVRSILAVHDFNLL